MKYPKLVAAMVIGLLVLVSLVITGCWNRREIDTLATVMAAGIDGGPGGRISVTVQVAKPGEIKPPGQGGGGGGQPAVAVFTSTGATVFDAVRNFALQAERKLFWPHCKALVIGEETARAGISPLLDFIDRDHEPRELMWVLIARGQAKDIISAEGELEKITAESIEKLVKARIATSKVVGIRLYEFRKMLGGTGRDPFATGIELVGAGEGKKRLKLTETAVFRKDRLMGWLDSDETRGLMWILGEVRSGIIVVPAPGPAEGKVSLEIIRASSKLKPEIKDGYLTMTIEIEEEGNLGEQMAFGDFTKPELWTSLEKRKAEVIEREIRAVLKKAQEEWAVDIFGFGEAFRRKYPREWREMKDNWRDLLPTVAVEVKITAKLRRVGLITKYNPPK